MPLILASQSPRRRELLSVLGIPFTIDTADIDESVLAAEAPLVHVLRLAQSKARVVAERWGDAPDVVVLAADTIVVQRARILGKPRDAAEARLMLQSLRTAPHQVITAVAVVDSNGLVSGTHTSEVVMRPYSDAEIDAYIATGDSLDKAGAYAIQHNDFRPVAHFEGCFASIMGLPLGLASGLLQATGLTPDPDWPRACAAITHHCCHLLPS